MTKDKLHPAILEALQQQLTTAQHAAIEAYKSATDDENIAENKYDTLGLEAAYLAAGQSTRVTAYQEDIAIIEALPTLQFKACDQIDVGALVSLVDDQGNDLSVYLSPVAGGLHIKNEGINILLVTNQAPLGKALIGQYLDDEVSLTVAGQTKTYEIFELS